MTAPVILLIALLLDAVMGEPRALWSRVPHPAVLMGRAIAWGDQTLNK
ncbi:MAG: adenosylcobinamide-phosphate synthase, partial [Pseudomonadota bacterium]